MPYPDGRARQINMWPAGPPAGPADLVNQGRLNREKTFHSTFTYYQGRLRTQPFGT